MRRLRQIAMLLAAATCGGLALMQLGSAVAGSGDGARAGSSGAAPNDGAHAQAAGTDAGRSSLAQAAAGTDAGRSTLAEEGHQLFLSSCAACHGLGAQGIEGRGPSLHGAGAAAAAFYLETGRMPLPTSRQQPMEGEPAFPHKQIEALIAYVASFGGPGIPKVDPARGSISRGQELFALSCAGCHTIQASGGIVTGAVVPSLQRSSPRVIGEAIRTGPYVMPRFGEGQLSAGDVDSIARYVHSTQSPDNLGGWGIGRIGPIPEGMVAWLLAAAALLLIARLLGERTSEQSKGPRRGA